MKKLMYLALAFIAIATGFAACGLNNPSSQNKTLQIYHVGDSLFALQYDDYDFGKCREYFDTTYSESNYGGCSQVRKGDWIGRNLDYSINRNASAIIKIEQKLASNGDTIRYASIGVVGCFSRFTYNMADSVEHYRCELNSLYNLLPGRTVDGINENGVYVGVNVVPKRLDISNDGYFYEGKCDKDNAYNALYLTRLVLDSAKSVKHAIELIKSHTWYFPKNYPTKDEEHTYQPFHWMIADTSMNCIVEMEDHKFVFLTSEKPFVPGKYFSYVIMTNFSNKLHLSGHIDSLGTGYERWNMLLKHYDSTKTDFHYGMFDLMKKVWFSQSYTNNCSKNDYKQFWFSELANPKCHADKLFHEGARIVQNNEAMRQIGMYKDQWNDSCNWYTDTTHLWYTVHTSVYNLNDKTLSIIPHEGFLKQQKRKDKIIPYNFNFNIKFPLHKEEEIRE